MNLHPEFIRHSIRSSPLNLLVFPTFFNLRLPTAVGSLSILQPRDRTQVSLIADEFFTSGATGEALRGERQMVNKDMYIHIQCYVENWRVEND